MTEDNSVDTEMDDTETIEYVTVKIGGQLFGMPISAVGDIFLPQSITPVPLSATEILGVLNLRGRVVTAIDMRKYLGLPPREDGKPSMAVGVDFREESYGLIIDGVGEVLRLGLDTYEANPSNLAPCWVEISKGVHRLENELMLILDIDRILNIDMGTANAA